MKQQARKSVLKRIVHRSITLVCLGVFSYSLYQLAVIFIDYWQNDKVLSEIQQVYVYESIDQTNEGEIRESFDPLLAINEDIVGWITVNNTKIDYPILQADDNDYYLDRNYRHEHTRAGSIFMDFRNDIQANDPHTILYGHRMRDGSMFAQLAQFLEQDFVDHHEGFYYDTLYDRYDVEVFSAYVTTTDFYYIETEFPSKDDYKAFLNELKKRSVVQTNVEVREEDQIITLSTCDYRLDRDRGRLVVHGKLIPRT
ncbi:class B sortase [Halalkalibacterium halodurans]|jgi:sortase B|uniref:Sortase n=1 Tax=Halalkalibacterium halodurans TaxID=86665 RepID=A0A0M0KHW7_ALKHA|nr:class B sortase [Halalkalibacterium halodurans]MED4162856.1 class B sortase [Halalkalibacterium halodurans]TPE68612.1 class B sortase [Halalkalibacterium halodurans]